MHAIDLAHQDKRAYRTGKHIFRDSLSLAYDLARAIVKGGIDSHIEGKGIVSGILYRPINFRLVILHNDAFRQDMKDLQAWIGRLRSTPARSQEHNQAEQSNPI